MKCQVFLPITLFVITLCLTFTASAEQANAKVRAPLVYSISQRDIIDSISMNKKSSECSGIKPYTGEMEFRSRYEGSGNARDKVNKGADEAYKGATAQITQMQQYVARSTDRILKGKGNNSDIDCLVNTLLQWARQSTLLQKTDNHTAKAVRKWTLGTVSSNLLKVWVLVQKRASQDDLDEILDWISAMSDQVVSDYSNSPLTKINNHHYWAAWAVMTSAVLLDRHDLFYWSKDMFDTAMMQIDGNGYLPNELRRNSRAALYHNYALSPLVGIAVFLNANGINPFDKNNQALARLTAKVVESVQDNAENFKKVTGKKQSDADLTDKGRLAWLAMYNSIAYLGPPDVADRCLALSKSGVKLHSTRLGGELEFLYMEHEN